MIAFLVGSEYQFPGAILDIAHYVRRIAQEVQNYLLNLYAIAINDRQKIVELMLQDYIVFLQLARQEREDFTSCLIQVDWLNCTLPIFEETPQPIDHLRSAITISDRS